MTVLTLSVKLFTSSTFSLSDILVNTADLSAATVELPACYPIFLRLARERRQLSSETSRPSLTVFEQSLRSLPPTQALLGCRAQSSISLHARRPGAVAADTVSSGRTVVYPGEV